MLQNVMLVLQIVAAVGQGDPGAVERGAQVAIQAVAREALGPAALKRTTVFVDAESFSAVLRRGAVELPARPDYLAMLEKRGKVGTEAEVVQCRAGADECEIRDGGLLVRCTGVTRTDGGLTLEMTSLFIDASQRESRLRNQARTFAVELVRQGRGYSVKGIRVLRAS
jgi:hypothetical protein